MNRHAVRYASDYLVEGQSLPGGPGFHQISLAWNRNHPEAEGSCDLDPNICGLDQFGDPTFCTRIAVQTRVMKLSAFDEKPGYQAYTMTWRVGDSGDTYEEVPLRVVTITEPGQDMRARLLVLAPDRSPDRSPVRIIALHEVPST